MSEVVSGKRIPLPPEARKHALMQGCAGVFGATVWFLVLMIIGWLIDPQGNLTDEWWHRGLFGAFGIVGLAINLHGLRRCSVARERRFDLLGLGALLVMLFGGLSFLICAFLTLILFSPGPIGFH